MRQCPNESERLRYLPPHLIWSPAVQISQITMPINIKIAPISEVCFAHYKSADHFLPVCFFDKFMQTFYAHAFYLHCKVGQMPMPYGRCHNAHNR